MRWSKKVLSSFVLLSGGIVACGGVSALPRPLLRVFEMEAGYGQQAMGMRQGQGQGMQGAMAQGMGQQGMPQASRIEFWP